MAELFRIEKHALLETCWLKNISRQLYCVRDKAVPQLVPSYLSLPWYTMNLFIWWYFGVRITQFWFNARSNTHPVNISTPGISFATHITYGSLGEWETDNFRPHLKHKVIICLRIFCSNWTFFSRISHESSFLMWELHTFWYFFYFGCPFRLKVMHLQILSFIKWSILKQVSLSFSHMPNSSIHIKRLTHRSCGVNCCCLLVHQKVALAVCFEVLLGGGCNASFLKRLNHLHGPAKIAASKDLSRLH